MRVELIAEIGQNHNGDMDLAEELIVLAKKGGADVAKFQVYEAKSLFPPAPENPWYDYNCQTELTKKQVYHLAELCKKNEIEFMASVFDLERLTWLEDIGVKRYKIASRSIYDTHLLEAVKKTKKPILISLGKWVGDQLPVVNTNTKVEFMHCVSNYPASLSELNLHAVNFKKINGFSDHSLGITAACAAMVMGCSIIEKHFTYDKNAYGPDHLCSMNIGELERLREFRDDWETMSNPKYK